jgi:nitrate reductase gamma subunit
VGVGVAKPVDRNGPGGTATPSVAVANPVATKRVAWTPRSGDVSTQLRPHGRLDATLLFLAFPYIAVLVLLLGLGIRHAMMLRRPDTARGDAGAAWQLFSGGPAWRVGLIGTVILHLLVVVAPHAVLSWNSSPMKLYVLEGAGLALAVLALIGWIQIMRGYLARGAGRARTTAGEFADGILLSLLGLAILSGIVTAVLYRWSSSWTAGTVAPYLRSLLVGVPATELIEELPFLARLHTLAWFAVIALVPFTSFALVIVSIAHRILHAISRPFEAGAQAGRRAAAKLSPARWLWPEEDPVERLADDKAQEQS